MAIRRVPEKVSGKARRAMLAGKKVRAGNRAAAASRCPPRGQKQTLWSSGLDGCFWTQTEPIKGRYSMKIDGASKDRFGAADRARLI